MERIIRNQIIAALAFAIVMICGAFVFADRAEAATIVDQGTCGENTTWTFDDEGLLTISGEGAMTDYDDSQHRAPWDSYHFSIKSVVVEQGVTHVGEYAFADTNVIKATVNNPETEIGYAAFYSCSLSQNRVNGFVIINDVLVSYLDEDAHIVNVPAGVKRIDRGAFYNFEGDPLQITTVLLPDGLEEIGEEAFIGCYLLSTIEIPETVKRIRQGAFRETGITSITFPDGIEEIEGWMFASSSLSSFTIPESVTRIGDGAFQFCRLTSMTIPESVMTIGNVVFYGCNLQNLTLPAGLEELGIRLLGNVGQGMYDPTRIGTVVLQGKNISLKSATMNNCTVEKLVIGKGITGLENNAFSECTISNIEVPGDITSLPGSGLGLQNMNSSVKVITDRGTFSDLWFRDKYPDCKYKYNIGAEQISVESCTYNGNPQTPAVTIEGLTEGTDFTVSYDQNVEVGTGIAIITGKGNYTNTVEKEFTINHAEALTPVPAAEPTCTAAGNIEHWECTVCGRLYADENGTQELSETEVTLASPGHNWNADFIVDTEPTCTAAGSKSIHCKACSAVKEETVIPELGHSYGESVVAPTCTKQGYTLHVCGRCGDTYTDSETTAAGHTFGEWEDVDAATCSAFGSQKRVCSACGCTETRGVDKKDHSYVSGNYEVDVAASCTTDGSESIKCEDCGTIITSRVIPTTGHQFGDWVVLEQPTCTTDGKQKHTCAVDTCGYEEEMDLPALGHQWADDFTVDVEPTCTEEGSKSVLCERDGCTETKYVQAIPAKGHTYVKKEQKAKIGIAGKSWKECSVCGAITAEKTIAALKPAATTISSLTAASKGFTVKWKKKSYTGYQIRYSLKSSMASPKTVNIAKATTVSKKITKLKAKKKYYVQVRTYKTVNGKKWYSAWSTKKAVTTKK